MYDNIADMDGQVGEILEQLTEDGLSDNTIVFSTGATTGTACLGQAVALRLRPAGAAGDPSAKGDRLDV